MNRNSQNIDPESDGNPLPTGVISEAVHAAHPAHTLQDQKLEAIFDDITTQFLESKNKRIDDPSVLAEYFDVKFAVRADKKEELIALFDHFTSIANITHKPETTPPTETTAPATDINPEEVKKEPALTLSTAPTLAEILAQARAQKTPSLDTPRSPSPRAANKIPGASEPIARKSILWAQLIQLAEKDAVFADQLKEVAKADPKALPANKETTGPEPAALTEDRAAILSGAFKLAFGNIDEISKYGQPSVKFLDKYWDHDSSELATWRVLQFEKLNQTRPRFLDHTDHPDDPGHSR